jgi:hypothetical protein
VDALQTGEDDVGPAHPLLWPQAHDPKAPCLCRFNARRCILDHDGLARVDVELPGTMEEEGRRWLLTLDAVTVGYAVHVIPQTQSIDDRGCVLTGRRDADLDA